MGDQYPPSGMVGTHSDSGIHTSKAESLMRRAFIEEDLGIYSDSCIRLMLAHVKLSISVGTNMEKLSLWPLTSPQKNSTQIDSPSISGFPRWELQPFAATL